MTRLADYFSTSHAPWYLVAVLAVVVVLAATRRFQLVFFVLAFPATLAHELTHLIFGWLTHGQPTGLRLWPRRTARGYALGSVTCRNVRWYNGLFIGLAPLALLPFAALLLRWRTQTAPVPDVNEMAWVYAVASLALAGLPSGQDLRVALASSWLLLAVMLLATLWAFGFLPHLWR